jgi:hypothetical protein
VDIRRYCLLPKSLAFYDAMSFYRRAWLLKISRMRYLKVYHRLRAETFDKLHQVHVATQPVIPAVMVSEEVPRACGHAVVHCAKYEKRSGPARSLFEPCTIVPNASGCLAGFLQANPASI